MHKACQASREGRQASD